VAIRWCGGEGLAAPPPYSENLTPRSRGLGFRPFTENDCHCFLTNRTLLDLPFCRNKGANAVDQKRIIRLLWPGQGSDRADCTLCQLHMGKMRRHVACRSGSCYGQALALMKHSIRSLIETLAENDFVNVANVRRQRRLF